MNLQQMRYLRGPNIHARCPIVEATVADTDAHAAEALARDVLNLQQQAGVPAEVYVVEQTDRINCFVVAIESLHETVGRAAMEMALKTQGDAASGSSASSGVALLQQLEYQQRLPASTAVVYHAARRRGIPARRLSTEYGRFLLLGQGSKQRRCQASEPDSVSAVARTTSTDKHLAKELMAAAGVPVPVGRIVETVDDAWIAACELGLPVAIKPQDSDLQIGVSLDLRTREQVDAAFHLAKENSRWVIVEQFAPGVEHRVLVVDGNVVAVTSIDPPLVVGDGVHTIAELVAEINADPRRGDDGSGLPWHKLKLDEVARGVLTAQNFNLQSVPPPGLRVLVRRQPPYFKHGGNLVDLTDVIHPTIAAHAAAGAEALQLRVAGLDVVAVDIRQPLEPQRGVVVEINAGPGLWLHLSPWASSPRPVGDAIVASMFPEGDTGRIPVIALVTRSGSDPEAGVLLANFLATDGSRVGHASATTLNVAGRHWPAPTDPHERAQMLFQYPGIDVAILETTPAELLATGFGNDRCDMAILLSTTDSGCLPAVRNTLIPDGKLLEFRTAVEMAAQLTTATG